jgi:hypothetical protein
LQHYHPTTITSLDWYFVCIQFLQIIPRTIVGLLPAADFVTHARLGGGPHFLARFNCTPGGGFFRPACSETLQFFIDILRAESQPHIANMASIWSRKLDVLYIVFFFIHLAAMFAVDLYHFYPPSFRPEWMIQLRTYYIESYKDRFFTAPP